MNKRIIVALDKSTYAEALNLAGMLDPNLCRVKVGKELFTATGPALVEALMRRGFEVFLDLKFHDIPNTVAGAIRSASNLGVWIVNVHCLGGRKMMEAAVEAVKSVPNPPKLIGVTVLTSMDAYDLAEVGIPWSPAEHAVHLASLAQRAGLDGVVCSGQEAGVLREHLGKDFILVTPGIRLPEGSADDQARIITPGKAILAGASYLVIGRPITKAADPLVALYKFNEHISLAQTEAGLEGVMAVNQAIRTAHAVPNTDTTRRAS